MITTPKIVGLLAVAFVAGSFVASPELRAYAAATIGSAEIIDNSIQSVDIKDGEIKMADIGNGQVTAAKIKDGEVKAAEIATDAVGADELKGVSKLIFGSCSITFPPGGSAGGFDCPIAGARAGDRVIASLDSTWFCGSAPLLHSAHIYSDDHVSLTLEGNTSCGQNSINAQIILFK